jgi:hypothetical protein
LASVVVPAAENRSWPDVPIDLRAGAPIDQYGTAQQRKVAWLRDRVIDGTIEAAKVVFWPAERLDEIHAVASRGAMTHPGAGGDIYRGGYNLAGERHGEGTATLQTGETYVGGWVEGKNHGEGACTFANGNTYVGGWAEGLMHGEGTYIFARYRHGMLSIGEGSYQKSARGMPKFPPSQKASTKVALRKA